MKRDKWFLNSPSKWNMHKGLKNIYDWYLILTFPTAIFLKVHAHYRHELVFFGRFSRPRGGVHYTTLNTVIMIWLFLYHIPYQPVSKLSGWYWCLRLMWYGKSHIIFSIYLMYHKDERKNVQIIENYIWFIFILLQGFNFKKSEHSETC